MRRAIWAVLVVAVVAVTAAAATAQPAQRFNDVPPSHEAHDAVEWAAGSGLTVGYGDGTFKPDQPLSKWHAVVFMERYFDEILGADQSGDFTRGDMMRVLHAVSGAAATAETPAVRVIETVTHSPKAWGAFVGTGSDNLCWILVQHVVNSSRPIQVNVNCDPDTRPGMTPTTTTTSVTTTTTAPRAVASCTHHHAGNPTHTHRRYSDGTVSGHGHAARSDTKCGYLWQ